MKSRSPDIGLLQLSWHRELPLQSNVEEKDQFDQLYEDAADSGRVMALALHPFVIGQPFRHKYLVRALEYIVSREGVWVTTSDDIATHYLRTM